MKSVNIALMLVISCIFVGIINSQGLTVTGPNIPPGIPAPEGVMTWINLKLNLPSMPRVGEVFNVEFTISCINDLENTKFGPDYTVTFSSNTATILTGKEYKYSGYMKNGEVKKFTTKMIINKAEPSVSVKGIITADNRGWHPQVIGFVIFLVDENTGQYGTKEEYDKHLNKTAPQWFYDPAGEFTNEPVSPDAAAENLKIIARIKELNPDLTDWEALYLHYDGIQALMGGMGDGKTSWEDRWGFLLERGWLEKQRQGKDVKDKWLKEIIEKYKGKSLTKEQGFNPIFFRSDSNNIVDNNNSSLDSTKTKRWSYFYFDGQFRYKKHQYTKDQGLLVETVDMPICSVLVRVRAYWSGQGTIWTIRTNTDASGYFHATLSWEVPEDINIYAHPMIYFWGPEPTSLKIKVSDPSPTSYYSWRDPLDTTIYLLPRVQSGVDTIWTGTDTYDFGTMYIDSFILGTTPQPKSGAANISQTYLDARTFMNPSPTRSLRVMWDLNYNYGTAMNMTKRLNDDTVWVRGDTLSSGTDEWDDDVLLHEFGHYVMKSYTQPPPTDTGAHNWFQEFSGRPGIAYGEGWAYFFSSRTKVGSSMDSLSINTENGIGADSVYWHSIENPWLSNFFDTTWFEGGPWCEGAVAGTFWDIYDSKNEIPYHSYPDYLYGVWFPDTDLADSLTMGFDEIWNVFDNYNPAGPADTNCQNIFQFRSGWNYNEYDHAFALNQMLLHHRILDTIPAAPTGLTATSVLGDVRLYWHKNAEPDLQGYRVFRRDSTTMNPTPLWTSWALLVEKNTDTTHLDTTTVSGGKYRYRLTAFDSLGNESGYSDSVTIKVRGKGDIDKQPLFGLTKTIVRDIQGIEFFIPEGRKEVFVKIYDCCGRIVIKQQIHIESGNLCEISLKNSRFDHLPSGVYFLSLETDKSDKIVEKFVIMK